MKNLDNYLKRLDEETPGISQSVKTTTNEIIPAHIRDFSCREHITGLLLGHVQSGKTSQVFGIISAAADEGFKLFILLTSDNRHLQEQTFSRACRFLENTFCVCSEMDEIRFIQNAMRRPVLIVIKKNTRVLQTWRDNLTSSGFCQGHPLFIIDDEGDNASLNTKINQDEQSTINRHLETIRNLANSSIYLQVTATPQALFLQSSETAWRPSFVYFFPPGKGYLGGEFFYSDPMSYVIRLTTENELDDLREDENYITPGLQNSVLSFLISASHIILKKERDVCNFLIHPSVRIADQETIASRIGEYLNQILLAVSEDQMTESLEQIWFDLQSTKPDLISFSRSMEYIHDVLENDKIKIILMNSRGSLDTDSSKGLNIIIGGNSLGRGVTFNALQTIYYCRQSRAPQADTYWQHCRMFGYDRDPALMRIFLPPFLYRVFTSLNNSNLALIEQVISSQEGHSISLLYPPNIRPTRKNVVDNTLLDVIAGGVNYFPFYPAEDNQEEVNTLLQNYDGKEYSEESIDFLVSLLEKCKTNEDDDWKNTSFINCLRALQAGRGIERGILIVRKDRNIGRATGTLLSPDDRSLGDQFVSDVVLTLYNVIGEKDKGWKGHPFWIPNIKLPRGETFYKVD